MKPSIRLGTHAVTGRPLFLEEEKRQTHMLVLGRTGSGKTKFLEYLLRQDIRAGHGLCLLDPDGDLYDSAVDYCAARGNLAHRVVLIDPNEDRWRFGLNYFDVQSMAEQKRVDLFLEACYKVLGQPVQETKVLFERWGSAAALPLVRYPTPLTVADLHPMLTDPAFRRAVLSRIVGGNFVAEEWRHFEQDLQTREQNMALLAVFDRLAKLLRDERMEEVFGQPNTINWVESMNRGDIVLVNLRPLRVSQSVVRMIGVVLIHQIVDAAMQRDVRPKPRPFYVYADEFSALVTEDFRTALTRLRKRGVGFILAQQNLSDLRLDDDDRLYHAVLGGTTTKVVFSMVNAEEAAIAAEHLFATQINGLRVKWQGPPLTHAIPHTVEGEVTSSSWGGSDSSDSSSGHSDTGGDLLTEGGISHTDSHADRAGSSSSYSETTTTQHWVEYEYETVEQAPIFKSPDEERLAYRREIMAQEIGEARVLHHPKHAPLELRVPFPGSAAFPDVRATPSQRERLIEAACVARQLRTPAEVRELIAARRREVLALPEGDDIEGAVTKRRASRRAKKSGA